MPLDIGVLVSGRGSNLEAILDSIAHGRITGARVSVVVSSASGVRAVDVARRFGVDTVVLDAASLRLSRQEYDDLLAEQLARKGISQSDGLVVLAGFDRILGAGFVNKFAGRLINVHPALLPSFKGLHAQRQAVEYGVKVSGCTVHFVVADVDAGPIILQKAVEVKDDDDEESLSERILRAEHEALPQAIQMFATGRLKVNGRRVVVA